MPRRPRYREESENVKEKILTAALEIITSEGYTNLSMRKIARKTGMTAANIYNYFKSKDELFLILQKKAFEKLYLNFLSITKDTDSPLDKILKIIEAYINFGITNKNYYEVMFIISGPKYFDFIGTEFEKLAFEERQTGIKVFQFLSSIVQDAFPNVDAQKAKFYIIEAWSTIHGIVTLYNYYILPALEDHPLEMLTKMKEEAFQKFVNNMKKASIPEKKD